MELRQKIVYFSSIKDLTEHNYYKYWPLRENNLNELIQKFLIKKTLTNFYSCL